MTQKKLFTGCLAAVFAALITMTGCEDGNLFGRLHDRGDSGDTASLLSDAEGALRDRNFSEALALYERVLAQDSDNSEALKGAATAALANAGLNLGQLVTNIINNNGAPGVHDLGTFIQGAREGVSASNAATNSILNGINLTAIDAVIDTAICRLQRVVSGASDGRIPSDDVGIMLNLGTIRLIRSVLRAIESDYFDLVNNNGTYDIQINQVNADTFCGNAANRELIELVGQDIAAAYALFNRAVSELNLSGNEIIVQLRDDINSAATTLLTPAGPNALPTNCLNVLSNIGITLATFQSQTGAFEIPSSGC